MGFNFPSSPTIGQVHPPTATPGLPQYTWDGVTWTMRGTPINPKIVVSDTPPANPEAGTMWWNGSDGRLYVYYFDGDASFWVQAAASLSDVDQSQLLKKAGDTMAGPLALAADPTADMQATSKRYTDMMAANNLVINGSFEVSQEFGTTATLMPNNSFKYSLDQWNALAGGNGTFAFQQHYGPGPFSSICARLRLYCGTPFNMSGANDLLTVCQPVEGLRWSKLGWGFSGAQPVTIGFWVYATVAGAMSVLVRNGAANNRNYTTPVIINAAAAWEYKTVTIPADVTGTWTTDATFSSNVYFVFGAGSGYQGPPNVWSTSPHLGHTGVTNFFATSNNEIYIAAVSIVPGNIGPSAAQSRLMLRTYDQDLALCMRYYVRLDNYVIDTGTYCQPTIYPVPMRITPTVSGGGAGFALTSNPISALMYQTTRAYQNIVLNARM